MRPHRIRQLRDYISADPLLYFKGREEYYLNRYLRQIGKCIDNDNYTNRIKLDRFYKKHKWYMVKRIKYKLQDSNSAYEDYIK